MQLADDWVAKSSLPLVWSVPSAVQRGYTRITTGKIWKGGDAWLPPDTQYYGKLPLDPEPRTETA